MSLSPTHQVAVTLAHALVASRTGDLGPVRALRWPRAGVARANLPVGWLAELAAAGHAAHNAPPPGLVDALGASSREALREVGATHVHQAVRGAAKRLRSQIPAAPAFRLQINALGPLEVRRDGEPLDTADLRRQRVRELLSYMVLHPSARREQVGTDLWPDVADVGHNLRVTLNYAQRLLQPARADGDPPYFLRSTGPMLELVPSDHLSVDVWQFEAAPGEADAAERSSSPGAALAAYRTVLQLWRGEPLVDVPYAEWSITPREKLRRRFTAAAVRAGELLLAIGDRAAAADAARRAIHADRHDETGYRLLIRCCVSDGDTAAARVALGDCRSALGELGVEPARETEALLTATR
jgi:LuxR family transcriptional regulator, maltose regulon positive regulatory protein